MTILKYELKRIPTLCTIYCLYIKLLADTDDSVWGEVLFECL